MGVEANNVAKNECDDVGDRWDIAKQSPALLQGATHRSVERWRQRQQLERTKKRRPDLLTNLNEINSSSPPTS